MFLNFSSFEPKTVFKLFLCFRGVVLPASHIEHTQIFIDVLLHHKANQNWNRILNIVLIIQKLIA